MLQADAGRKFTDAQTFRGSEVRAALAKETLKSELGGITQKLDVALAAVNSLMDGKDTTQFARESGRVKSLLEAHIMQFKIYKEQLGNYPELKAGFDAKVSEAIADITELLNGIVKYESSILPTDINATMVPTPGIIMSRADGNR